MIHIIKKTIKYLFKLLYSFKKEKLQVLYKIGNVKHHNAFIDVLTPQFVEIGDNFVSAPRAIILSHDASLFNKYGVYRIEKTIIGNDVFLGAGAIILPGVKIGDGAIIGSGAIVTKDVMPRTVVAGNPAKFISTVDDYYKKCKEKNCLFEATDNFYKNWKKRKLMPKELLEFQAKVINEAKKRN